jgi:mTERF domain-containing protein
VIADVDKEHDDDEDCKISHARPTLTLEDMSQMFAPDVSYFYLQNELGLPEATMWKITYEASSALGMTTATIRRKIDVLRETMDLTDDDIRSILERHPTILHLSADKNISPTILFLLRALNLGRDDLRAIVLSSPCILSYSTANLKSKIRFFTHLLQFSAQEARDLFLKEPKLLRAGVNTGLVPHMRFLIRDLEIPLEMLRSIVQKHPRILLYSVDKNLSPKLIHYMSLTLQMDQVQVQKILLTYPAILAYNLDRHILPITDYFVKDLEYSGPSEFRNILLKFPRLMTYSLSKIKHVVGYLRYEVGLNASQVKRVLYQAPQVIGLQTDVNLKNKVKYLQDTYGLTDDQLRRVITGMPTLLILSPERNLQPKAEYLLQRFGNNKTLLRDAVLRLPTLLGYSLEKRIRPRLEAIVEAGLDPSTSITVGIPMTQVKYEAWLQ